MLEPIVEFLGSILNFIYDGVGNYGIAIIIFTLMVRMITFPLSTKQVNSALQMQKLQPELKKIKEKYKNDKEKQNKETMEYMKKHNVNPLAGCLPILVQFPILISIFHLLRNPESFTGAEPIFLGLNLTLADPTYTMPLIAGVTTFLHQKLMMTDPNQKMMLYILPAVITVVCLSFPAGLVLYFVVNNLFSVAHHLTVTRTFAKGAFEEK